MLFKKQQYYTLYVKANTSERIIMPNTNKQTNLVNEVTSILAELCHVNPYAWMQDPTIIQALNSQDHNTQRFLINRYWRIKLGSCNTNSSEQRFCLFDDDTDKAYLAVFKKYVAPFIVHHNL